MINHRKPPGNTIDLDYLLNEEQASGLLGCSKSTLKMSRHTGELYGRPGPSYLKLGRRNVRYRHQTIDSWIGQFDEVSSTANY